MSDEEQGAEPIGFCPEVMETFFLCAGVFFLGSISLRTVLEYWRAENYTLALARLKALKYSGEQMEELTDAVEELVYASICPHR